MLLTTDHIDHYSLASYCENAARNLREQFDNPAIEVTYSVSTQDERGTFPTEARTAFEFLRSNADGRYSSRSLMQVLQLAEMRQPDRQPPYFIFRAHSPWRFDEDTEVKQGGTLGVLVQTNNGQGRAMLAVSASARRKGVATALVQAHSSAIGAATYWVAPDNVVGQQFLLTQGFQVVQMNRQGALRYGLPYALDDEEEVA